jgi:hypothetical protein
MRANVRRKFPGTLMTHDLGEGTWRLSRGGPAPLDVFLRGADFRAADALRLSGISDVDIEWCAENVVLTITSAGRRNSISVQSAIVHEPLGRLYEALPLVSLDEKARRFWRRVFWLARIPGGRHLLGVLARRTRGGG